MGSGDVLGRNFRCNRSLPFGAPSPLSLNWWANGVRPAGGGGRGQSKVQIDGLEEKAVAFLDAEHNQLMRRIGPAEPLAPLAVEANVRTSPSIVSTNP